MNRHLLPSLRALIAFLASLKLAVVLLVLLATLLAAATLVETRWGAEFAQWYVYDSLWFVALLALLGVNIFAAAAVRFPWKRHQTGFVVTHAGLLMLLAGSIQTFLGGIEGQVSLVEGERINSFVLPGRCQITAKWASRPDEPSYEFLFAPGPSDWRSSKTLDLGQVDGVRARVLDYRRHAKPVARWSPDKNEMGGPVVQLHVSAPGQKRLAEPWLSDQQLGDALFVGPVRVQLQRAATDRMLEDFLHPPTDELGERGILLIYYQDTVRRVPVDESVGDRIALGETGVEVELAEYLADATPTVKGQFTSKGDYPKNPLLELRVYMPGDQQPQRQIALAKTPLLNLDGIGDRICPVKFRYYHPKFPSSAELELLQTSDGKLFGRTFAQGEFGKARELTRGDSISLPGNFEFEIAQYYESGRPQLGFEPASDDEQATAAAEVEIAVRAVTQRLWLQRSGPTLHERSVATPDGTLQVQFERARTPLGFSLQLVDFQRELNPGEVGNAGFSSVVRLTDAERGVDEEHMISMNEPLSHRRFTFYQSGFSDSEPDHESSTFSVVYDPGRPLKYAGSLMICCGIAIMFYMRAYFFGGSGRSSLVEK